MNQIVRTLIVVSLAMFLVACGQSAKPAKPPNFIIIILDDWGWKDYGHMTHGIVTPNIDAIAESGFVFENAFLTTSSCSPSRASILMGRYPTATGGPNLHDPIPDGYTSLPEELTRRGYFTESSGKWHLDNFQHRFEKVYGSPGDSGAENWITALRQRPKDKPFFMWFASYDPHIPNDAPERFRVHDPDAISIPSYLADSPVTRQAYAAYLNEISRVDAYIGQVMLELGKQGEAANTWVFVLADNGAPTPFAKTTLYDTGIKTPLLVAGPGGKGRFTGLVSSVDLAPTILALAGVNIPAAFQGKSFARAFADHSYPHREYIFAEQNNHGAARSHTAVRSKDFLLIRNHFYDAYCANEMFAIYGELSNLWRSGHASALQGRCFDHPASVEFYKVGGEGYEVINLAGQPAYQAEQLRLEQALDAWSEEYREGACQDIECARLLAVKTQLKWKQHH